MTGKEDTKGGTCTITRWTLRGFDSSFFYFYLVSMLLEILVSVLLPIFVSCARLLLVDELAVLRVRFEISYVSFLVLDPSLLFVCFLF